MILTHDGAVLEHVQEWRGLLHDLALGRNADIVVDHLAAAERRVVIEKADPLVEGVADDAVLDQRDGASEEIEGIVTAVSENTAPNVHGASARIVDVNTVLVVG
jgi:hypothetical protein